MRWLVFFLLVLNALMFAWFSFQDAETEQKTKAAVDAKAYDFSKGQALVMMSELPSAQLEQRDTRAVEEPEPVLMCTLIGAFPEMITAKQVAGRLSGHGLNAKVVSLLQKLPPVHWVYIAPSSTRAAALKILRKLQAKRVDSFLVADGEYANAISLGYFSKIESARAIMEAQKEAGYDAHAILKEREEEAFFLAFDAQDSVKFSTDLLENLQLENKQLKKQEKDCETVASLKVIE